MSYGSVELGKSPHREPIPRGASNSSQHKQRAEKCTGDCWSQAGKLWNLLSRNLIISVYVQAIIYVSVNAATTDEDES